MTKFLWVGDPHAEPHDLGDCRALADYVIKIAVENDAVVVLAGDLYDTHAIIHADVQLFWWEFFEELRLRGITVIVLKGNHDQPGTEGSKATSLLAHYFHANCVLYGPKVVGKLLFCPYASAEDLVRWSEQHQDCKVLFCHQTFDGSVYDNGFFAGDGVDPNLIKQKLVISGHIHMPQAFGKVWYPGAPRWRTLNDANFDRALWLLEFSDDGDLLSKTAFDTGSVCRRIIAEEDTIAKPIDLEEAPAAKDEWHVTIKGPAAFVEERLPLFQGRARVRTVRTDAKATVRVRESEGIAVAFDKFVDSFEPRRGTDKVVLKEMARDRVTSGL